MATAYDLSGMICVGAFILSIWVPCGVVMIRQRKRYSERLPTLFPDWASKEGYTILFQDRLPFWSTPFMPTGEAIHYRVVVEDKQGRKRRGWV